MLAERVQSHFLLTDHVPIWVFMASLSHCTERLDTSIGDSYCSKGENQH